MSFQSPNRMRQGGQPPMPERGLDRLLLALGALALTALVPLLWTWLLYGSRLTGLQLDMAALGLGGVTVAIGAAMIRILEGGR
jgi:hypothetical protein